MRVVDQSVSIFDVVVSKGFWISEVLSGVVFRVCVDVEKVIFGVVTEVDIMAAGEVNFVVLMVSEAVCVLPLDITVGTVVFSVSVKASETLGVSVLEVWGDETLTVGVVACVVLMLVETGVLTLVGSLLEVDDKPWLAVSGKGIVVVPVSGVEDSGLLVVVVTRRDGETAKGLVCIVVGEVGL